MCFASPLHLALICCCALGALLVKMQPSGLICFFCRGVSCRGVFCLVPFFTFCRSSCSCWRECVDTTSRCAAGCSQKCQEYWAHKALSGALFCPKTGSQLCLCSVLFCLTWIDMACRCGRRCWEVLFRESAAAVAPTPDVRV